ncbi:unnamed protein product [Boreogadus saida]
MSQDELETHRPRDVWKGEIAGLAQHPPQPTSVVTVGARILYVREAQQGQKTRRMAPSCSPPRCSSVAH